MRALRGSLLPLLVCACLGPPLVRAEEQPQAPFEYVWARAYEVMPETYNQEGGYFSLCEGLDGRIYIGTCKHNVNAYLVQFDPQTEQQRIALDANEACTLSAVGFAAQAKIHTRNFVAASGAIYVGTMQDYADAGDASQYPGGYVLRYDPQTDRAECLGMPCPGEGIADVAADEARGLVYVITAGKWRWMVADLRTRRYREIGPPLAPFSATVVDGRGRANALTAKLELAQHDPDAGKTTVRPITVHGTRLSPGDAAPVPTWRIDPDGHRTWMILLNDPTLIEIELSGEAPAAQATSHGKMIEGRNPDSRCALGIGPDGRIYAVVRIDNETGFGGGFLHHLVRFDPQTGRAEDLGVIAVQNPDYFDFGPGPDGRPKPWAHGFQTLPDGTLTPLHAHMAMIVARDGTIYVTVLSPFTLLRIPQLAGVR